MDGVGTLWGSFEIQNHRMLKKMLFQYAKKDHYYIVNHFDSVASQFEKLPLHLLKFHGNTNIDDLLDAMEYAVYVHDVSHVVLDNLQFMVGDQAMGAKRFDLQDQGEEVCFSEEGRMISKTIK